MAFRHSLQTFLQLRYMLSEGQHHLHNFLAVALKSNQSLCPHCLNRAVVRFLKHKNERGDDPIVKKKKMFRTEIGLVGEKNVAEKSTAIGRAFKI